MLLLENKKIRKVVRLSALALALSACFVGMGYANGFSQIAGSNAQYADSDTPIPTTSSSSDSSHTDALDDQAFASMSKKLMPLTPAQITLLHANELKTKKAVQSYPVTPPTPTSNTLLVSLSPGATPNTIRMANGYISTLNFVDSTGQVWPIQSYDLGDPKDFTVKSTKDGSSLFIQPTSDFTMANIAVMLKGLSTPIMFTLIPGQRKVDYRDDIHVPGNGPNALPGQSQLPHTESPSLLNVLDGIPPSGSTQYATSMPNTTVWRLGSRLYVRTKCTIISPSWISTMQSPDGMHAYELSDTPVLLALQNGNTVNIKIGGKING